MSRLKYSGLLAAVMSLGMVACGDDTPTVDPTPIEPVRVTEEFTGALNLNGAATYPFLLTTPGVVDLTVMNIDPNPDGTRIGIALGTWNGTVCQIILANDSSFVSTVVTGAGTGVGFACARVYDVGKMASAVAFDIRIEHP